MALTSGAKKFLGLIATVAIVGGGIYGYKQYAAHHPAQPVAEVVTDAPAAQEPVEVPQPVNSPIAQTEHLNEATDAASTSEQEPMPAQVDPSSNRGLANVLNAAKNK